MSRQQTARSTASSAMGSAAEALASGPPVSPSIEGDVGADPAEPARLETRAEAPGSAGHVEHRLVGELRPEGVEEAVHEPWVALPRSPRTPAPRGVMLAVAVPLPAGVDGGGVYTIHDRILTGPGLASRAARRSSSRSLAHLVPARGSRRSSIRARAPARAWALHRPRDRPRRASHGFRRLDDISGVDWPLPPDDPSCAGVLGGAAKPVDLRIGVATWSDSGLAARLGGGARDASGPTPARCRPTNSTAPSTATPRALRALGPQVPRGFLFCPKLPSRISHERGLEGADQEMEAFVERSARLGASRGPLWFALPPFVGPSAFDVLRAFVERWSSEVDLAVEVREERWFHGRARADLAALLRANGATWILTDTAGRRDAAHMTLTTRQAFVRFVGNGLDPTDPTRLDAWAARIAAWARAGLERAFVFLHQRDEAQTIDLAEHLDAALVREGFPAGPRRELSGHAPPRNNFSERPPCRTSPQEDRRPPGRQRAVTISWRLAQNRAAGAVLTRS